MCSLNIERNIFIGFGLLCNKFFNFYNTEVYMLHTGQILELDFFACFAFFFASVLVCKYIFPNIYQLREKLHCCAFTLTLHQNGFSSSLDSLPAGGRQLPAPLPSSCLWSWAGFSRGVVPWLREATDGDGFANAFCGFGSRTRAFCSKTSFCTWNNSV